MNGRNRVYLENKNKNLKAESNKQAQKLGQKKKKYVHNNHKPSITTYTNMSNFIIDTIQYNQKLALQ